jgi:phosphoglucomutase
MLLNPIPIHILQSNHMNPQELMTQTQEGFKTLSVSQELRDQALRFLEQWLTDEQFAKYVPQLQHLINTKQWNFLLDAFYQVIPFGTGGRRGEVGIGPNRINPWTITTSAQGHAQYLVQTYGDNAKSRGVILAYDVREFFGNALFAADVPNPVMGLTSKDLAIAAARVYAANGIRVQMFPDVRATPELSFAIRRLNAVGGAMFSASHNPAEHNGKKVYDAHGGQLIPPYDEALINEVTKNVHAIKEIAYEDAVNAGRIVLLGADMDEAYIAAAASISLSANRDVKIIFSALHGCGMTSVYPVLRHLGFSVELDEHTSKPSGAFENITFRIPNPEVIQSFDATRAFAKDKDADIILSSDPDADRIGIMVRHDHAWIFLNGNDIAALLAEFVIQKRKHAFTGHEVMVKTMVTTGLLERICRAHSVTLISNLLIGFKYIADAMNTLEREGRENDFLFACEESHGYLAGMYSHDKDATVAAVWLAEYAAELKTQRKTLVDELHRLYAEYGYVKNVLTEIRLLGASGKENIDRIQTSLRKTPPEQFGAYRVLRKEDGRDRTPIVSQTDAASKDVLTFHLEPAEGVEGIKVTVRPSGTEPKTKLYVEIDRGKVPPEQLATIDKQTQELFHDLEKAVMNTCYAMIGVHMPERGFLLFWQLSLEQKLKYFEIEPQLEALKEIQDTQERSRRLYSLLAFLGSNPIEKIDEAFKAKHGVSVLTYLGVV